METHLPSNRPIDASEEAEAIYLKRAAKVTWNVIFDRVAESAFSKNISQSDFKRYFDSQLPIYIDALKRGESVVRERLENEGVSVDVSGEQTTLVYTENENGLTWKLSPKGTDAFERARVLKRLRDENKPISGESDFWTEPGLVSMAMEEGLAQQRSIYYQYIGTTSGLKEAMQRFGGLAKMVAFPTEEAQMLGQVELALSRVPGDSEDAFAKRVLLPNNPALGGIPILREGIDKLNVLGEFLDDVTSANRQGATNTWALELLSGSQSLDSSHALTFVKTSVDKVIKIRDFALKLNEGEDFELNCGLIAQEVINQNQVSLKKLIEQNDLPEDYTYDYFRRLVFDFLKAIPEDDTLNKPQLDSRAFRIIRFQISQLSGSEILGSSI